MNRRTQRVAGGWKFCLGATILVGAGFWFGQVSKTSPAAAQEGKGTTAPAASLPTADASKRVVAYVYGNIPITREEFGEYLIEVYAKDRLELFVNKKIIEMECVKKGVDVTSLDIDAAILEDCKKMNVDQKQFISAVLKRYGKTLDEWRQDVMKPRLLLAKLCRNQIVVADEELQQIFQNHFGEKAECKIILWPQGQKQFAEKAYEQARTSDIDFDTVASKQPDSHLASRAGKIDPIGRYSGPESAKIEEYAFHLKVGEISPIIDVPNLGHLIVKRVGTVPPVKGVEFEKVKEDLRKEVIDRKLEKEIPMLFAKMKAEADPKMLLDIKKPLVVQEKPHAAPKK